MVVISGWREHGYFCCLYFLEVFFSFWKHYLSNRCLLEENESIQNHNHLKPISHQAMATVNTLVPILHENECTHINTSLYFKNVYSDICITCEKKLLCVCGDRVLLCCLGCSAVAWWQLTVALLSQAQAVPPKPPKQLELQAYATICSCFLNGF